MKKSKNKYLNQILLNNPKVEKFVSDFNLSEFKLSKLTYHEIKNKIKQEVPELEIDIYGNSIILSNKYYEMDFCIMEETNEIVFEKIVVRRKISSLLSTIDLRYSIGEFQTTIELHYPEPDIFGFLVSTTLNMSNGDIKHYLDIENYKYKVSYKNDLDVILSYKDILKNEINRMNELIFEKKIISYDEKELYTLKYDLSKKVSNNDIFNKLILDINEIII